MADFCSTRPIPFFPMKTLKKQTGTTLYPVSPAPRPSSGYNDLAVIGICMLVALVGAVSAVAYFLGGTTQMIAAAK
jgi:hypothetical protein